MDWIEIDMDGKRRSSSRDIWWFVNKRRDESKVPPDV
jgi:hypothetical protein